MLTQEQKSKLDPEQLVIAEKWEREKDERQVIYDKLLEAELAGNHALVDEMVQELEDSTPNFCEHDRSIWSGCMACEAIEKILNPEYYCSECGERYPEELDEYGLCLHCRDINAKGITLAAAKAIYKQIVERGKKGEDTSNIDVASLVDEQNLWLSDEWTHVGFCILACLENQKLVDNINKGNLKVMDALLGKVIKMANTTVDAELIKELLPRIIDAYFKKET